MRKHPLDREAMSEIHAARRFRERLREDSARDAQWRKDRAKAQAQSDRKAARIDVTVRTAGVRIAAGRAIPTPLAVHQIARIACDRTKPGWARVEAAALVLEWTGSAPDSEDMGSALAARR